MLCTHIHVICTCTHTDILRTMVRYFFVVFSLLGFVFFDMVYLSVIVTYASQSELIQFYIMGIIDKVNTKAYSLEEAMKVRIGREREEESEGERERERRRGREGGREREREKGRRGREGGREREKGRRGREGGRERANERENKPRIHHIHCTLQDIQRTYDYLRVMNGKLATLTTLCLLIFIEALISCKSIQYVLSPLQSVLTTFTNVSCPSICDH